MSLFGFVIVSYFKTKLLKNCATICNVRHITHQNGQTNWLCYVLNTVCPICQKVCPICCEFVQFAVSCVQSAMSRDFLLSDQICFFRTHPVPRVPFSGALMVAQLKHRWFICGSWATRLYSMPGSHAWNLLERHGKLSHPECSECEMKWWSKKALINHRSKEHKKMFALNVPIPLIKKMTFSNTWWQYVNVVCTKKYIQITTHSYESL